MTARMSRLGNALGATTFDGNAALMAPAAEAHRAVARNIIEIEHKTATPIGSLVVPPVQGNDLMTSSAPSDDHRSRVEHCFLHTDFGINRTCRQHDECKYANTYDTHRYEIPVMNSDDKVSSKLIEFVAARGSAMAISNFAWLTAVMGISKTKD